MNTPTDSSNTTNSDQPASGEITDDKQLQEALKYAWNLYAVYGQSGMKRRRTSDQIGNWIFISTILVVFLAIILNFLKQSNPEANSVIFNVVRILVILAPITVSMLVTFANSFGGNVPRNFIERTLGQKTQNEGEKGEHSSIASESEYLFRASDQVQSHIMLCRTRLDKYSTDSTRGKTLVSEVNKIQKKLMQETPIKNISLEIYNGQIPPYYFRDDPNSDSGFGDLNGDQYVVFRLEPQLRWFMRIVKRREGQKRRNSAFIIFFGGLGTFLAAIGLEIWVTLTTAVAGAFSSILENAKLDQTISEYNKAISELHGLLAWWSTLTPDEKSLKTNIENLVLNSERFIIGEKSWIGVVVGQYPFLKESSNATTV